MLTDRDRLKQAAAIRAVDFVQSGMLLGLGTGSTAAFIVDEIAARLRDGRLRDIVGVPTSEGTRQRAKKLGIPLTTLDEHPVLDLTLDGADEVDPQFRLIKGGGGAHVREKIVAQAGRRRIIVVDEHKMVERLGTTMPVPVAVLPFGWGTHIAWQNPHSLQAEFGASVTLRRTPGGTTFVTDDGHYIFDLRFDHIHDPADIDARLKARAGIVETGLFIDMTEVVVVGTSGGVEVRLAP